MLMGSNSNGEVGTTMMLKKGPWSANEDRVLMEYVGIHGEGNWNAVQRNTGLQRCGKSCRLRWANHLRPNLKKGAFSSDEERLIIHLHSKLGNKWARISAHLPGRTDNEIKNYWNTRVKRRIRQGLSLYPNDPPTPTQEPQQEPPPPPPPKFNLTPPKTPPPTLSLFTPPFTLHPPPPTYLHSPSHTLKRCSNNSLSMGNPLFTSSGFGYFTNPSRESFGFGFDNGGSSFELPSIQFSHYNVNEEDKVVMGNKPNAGRTNNNGLLDDLLQEAHVNKVGLKREREEDSGFHWEVTSSENSSTGIKKEELLEDEHKLNFNNQGYSNILELIPRLVEAPTWCNDVGADSSAPQSSAVSIDDNYNGLLEYQMPRPPPFTAVNNATNYEEVDDGSWNPECYNWDNLPRIC